MAKPTRLKLVDERPAVPPREQDLAAEAPVAPQRPALSAEEAGAIIQRLREEAEQRVAEAQQEAEQAKAKVAETEATLDAVTNQARARIGELERERDAAKSLANDKTAERQKTTAVATAVCLGLAQKLATEMAKMAQWLPVVGALLGGFWLFDRNLPTMTVNSLLGLGLYGLVVVAPAVIVTLSRKEA